MKEKKRACALAPNVRQGRLNQSLHAMYLFTSYCTNPRPPRGFLRFLCVRSGGTGRSGLDVVVCKSCPVARAPAAHSHTKHPNHCTPLIRTAHQQAPSRPCSAAAHVCPAVGSILEQCQTCPSGGVLLLGSSCLQRQDSGNSNCSALLVPPF